MPYKREWGIMPDGTKPFHDLAVFIKPGGFLIGSIQLFSSILFRFFVYVFLRWIPSRAAYPAIPVLFAVYVLCWTYRQWRIRSAIDSYVNPKLQTTSDPKVKDDPSLPQPGRRDIDRVTVWDSFKAIVFGISSRSPRLNVCVLLAHMLVLLLFVDSFITPYLFPSHWDYNLSFARVGAVAHKSAKLHVRYPHPLPSFDGLEEVVSDDLGHSGVLRDGLDKNPKPVRVVWRRVPEVGEKNHLADEPEDVTISRMWERGPLLGLNAENDWTVVAELQDLWPSTTYEWKLAFVHNSSFTPMPQTSRRFTTFPDPELSQYLQTRNFAFADVPAELSDDNVDPNPLDDPNHFTFASTSCIKPDFPYHPAQFWGWNWLLKLTRLGNQIGGITERNRVAGFDLLYERTLKGKSKPSIRFLLQLGDLIYADVPHFAGATKNAYRKLYRNLFASDSFRRIYEKIPVLGIYDDHEVINNWSGQNADGSLLEAFPPANDAWKEYVGLANPTSFDEGENYYTFFYGGSAAFFVMDTRKHRSHHEHDDDESKTMLGEKQKQALIKWLSNVNTTFTFKFVVSSVPFNTLWGGPLDWDGQKDGWAVYMNERNQLASVMEYVPNLIILSGDRHEFAAVNIRKTITEFSTSPLSMFYLPIRTLSQDHGAGAWGEDQLLKYLPDGNHKWTEFEVDARDPLKPVLHVSVQIDGKEAWKVDLLGKQVKRQETFLGSVAKTLLELLGFKKRRWF